MTNKKELALDLTGTPQTSKHWCQESFKPLLKQIQEQNF